jgi:glycine/D-amino acid oxidase-like deaminating enzyme
MKSDSGFTRSIWADVPDLPARPALREHVDADVCVIGAGMAGLSTAYLLAREGKRVVVLDDGPVAGGETSRTTAHLTFIVDDRYHWIEHVHGGRGARIVAESHQAAVDRIESIVAEERIDCGFERLDGYLFVPPGDPRDELDREFEAAVRAGVHRVVWAQRAPLDGFETGKCLRFADQAQFHPLRYLAALDLAIERMGGRIHRDTHAASIEEGPPRRVIARDGGSVTAQDVVVATNSPVHTRLKIHPKQAAYRTYVIAARVPRGSVAKALYYDTLWPYHYVRLAGACSWSAARTTRPVRPTTPRPAGRGSKRGCASASRRPARSRPDGRDRSSSPPTGSPSSDGTPTISTWPPGIPAWA